MGGPRRRRALRWKVEAPTRMKNPRRRMKNPRRRRRVVGRKAVSPRRKMKAVRKRKAMMGALRKRVEVTLSRNGAQLREEEDEEHGEEEDGEEEEDGGPGDEMEVLRKRMGAPGGKRKNPRRVVRRKATPSR